MTQSKQSPLTATLSVAIVPKISQAVALLILLGVAAFAQQKGTLTDARDGKKYKTVQIGKQKWMAENLNYATNDSKCYGNQPANCEKVGKLYNWDAAMKACPSGWHLPSYDEWRVLLDFVGGPGTAGRKLKTNYVWNNIRSGNDTDTDDFGFSALPGGYVEVTGEFDAVNKEGRWWTSTENGEHNASGITMKNMGGNALESNLYKISMNSVRCVNDGASEIGKVAVVEGSFTDSRNGKKYKTAKIVDQTWMAENLNFDAKDSRCYDNKPENCNKYGRMYRWASAIEACPQGWHLPSDEEWKTLIGNAGGALTPNNTAGNKLKAKSGWNSNGTDDFSFSALPGGMGTTQSKQQLQNVSFSDAGSNGTFWSATNTHSAGAWIFLIMSSGFMSKEDFHVLQFSSVRCVKD